MVKGSGPSRTERMQGDRRRSASGKGPRRMPDLLGKLLGSEAKRRGLAEARLLTEWESVIGEAIAKHCQPVSLNRQGVLHLDVAGSAALELQHAELQVVERINMFFGRPVVSRLRLRQSPPRRRVLPPREKPIPALDPAKAAVIGEAVETVDDPDLREALASLGQTIGRKAKSTGW